MLFVLFQKLFPHLCLSRHALSKFIFQPKNVKIEKQKKLFWNAKFYHPAKFELKLIKSAGFMQLEEIMKCS